MPIRAPRARTAGRRGRVAAILLASLAALPGAAQDQQAGSRQGWPCVGSVDPAYVQGAEGTGGRVLMLHPSELGAPGAAAIMNARRDHGETVVRIVGQLDEGVHEFEVPVDSTIDSVDFFVSVQCLQAVRIVRPPGDELLSNDPDVTEYQQFEAIRRATVARPAPGRWTVTVAGRGLLFLTVEARAGLSLGRLTFLDSVRRPGSAPHEAQPPEAGTPQRVEIRVSGVDGAVAFRLISSSGATVQTLALMELDRSDAARLYRGEVRLDRVGSRLAMTGVDRNGFAFQRVDPGLAMTAPR